MPKQASPVVESGHASAQSSKLESESESESDSERVSERNSGQPPRPKTAQGAGPDGERGANQQRAGGEAGPVASGDDKPGRRIQRTRHPSRRGKVARRDP